MTASGEFDGKRALVTGGTKGIGQAVAARLREYGAKVLTTARGPSGDSADSDLFVAADITSADDCAAVADAVLKRLGGIETRLDRLRTRSEMFLLSGLR